MSVKSEKIARGLINQFEVMCSVGQKCSGCRYEKCETVVECAARFFADKIIENNCCAGCIHENDGEGDEACSRCCRNFEDDCFEAESE